jgi:hypothetical protein
MPLSPAEVEQFVAAGFVPLREAFPRALAARCRELLCQQLEIDPEDPRTWTRPVMRLGSQYAEPFCEAANTPRLHRALDLLVGEGRWTAHPHLSGTVAVRFPVEGDPGDDGWHIDGGSARGVNILSEGKALLMLFLFSDVGPADAPTRLRVGSHLDLAPYLATAGEEGLRGSDIVLPAGVHQRPIAHATGTAGDVYLCHPFLVHAADRNRGTRPRFVAQPGLLWKHQGGVAVQRLEVQRPDGAHSPVEVAVRMGLGLEGR